MRVVVLLTLAAMAMSLGCVVSEPGDGFEPMCFSDSDCDTASGEICDEGICYGDPPSTELAAVLVPSGVNSSSLVQTVIPSLSIAQNGDISGLQFSEPLIVTGKVTLVCSELTTTTGLDCGTDFPIDASIRVEREPAFPGGPPFRQTFTAKANVAETESSFTLTLPPLDADDSELRPYRITVTPLEVSVSGNVSAANIAPPLVDTAFTVFTSGDIEWQLGQPDETRWISSCLTGGAGVPDVFKNLPVTALSPGEAPVRVSSLARTDNSGCFSLRVPVELTSVTLLFQPDGTGPAPTITIANELVFPADAALADDCFGGSPAKAFCLPFIRGPDLTTPTEIIIPVNAQAVEGGSTAVSGAAVKLAANLMLATDPMRTGTMTASLEVRATSSANPSPTELGYATVLAPVSLTYEISVVPGPDSKFAALFGEPRQIINGGVQGEVRLKRRIAATGQIRSADGAPIAGATVTAEPTVLFKLSQSPEHRAILDTISITTTTDDDGSFFMWLEGSIDRGISGIGDSVIYDLAILPPFLLGPPSRFRGITTGANESLDIGSLTLPPASWARGPVTDSGGNLVAGVELQVWEPNAIDPCANMSLPDGECPAAARRVGGWLADAEGIVRIVLPDP